MSYVHNEEADFAASELARMLVDSPELCYANLDVMPTFSAYATHEASQSSWPLADGVVSLVKEAGQGEHENIAVEYKRTTEGVHGLLTAVGQTLAYIDKGYNGAIMVIPREYSSHSSPAEHVISVFETNGIGNQVGVFDYSEPDKSISSPFMGKLRCVKPLTVGEVRTELMTTSARPSTQWAHMREGSTTRDVVFSYLKSAIRLSCGGEDRHCFDIPSELCDAVVRINPNADVAEFLSYTSDNNFGSRVWRDFWFTYVATKDVLTIYEKENGKYSTPGAFTQVQKDDGSGHSKIFEGRSNGLKEFLVDKLNAGEISEDQAWEAMADGFKVPGKQNKQGVRARAHSYREDVDSSIAQLQWIDNGGHPTDAGYKSVHICERYGGANSNAAKEYFGATLIQTGHFGTFLHYVHRLSEELFSENPLAFTQEQKGQVLFTEESYWTYLEHIEQKLVDELRVMRKVSGRKRARVRTTFQAELTFLRKYGFLPESRSRRYRLGVGLPINWVKVHEAMQVEL